MEQMQVKKQSMMSILVLAAAVTFDAYMFKNSGDHQLGLELLVSNLLNPLHRERKDSVPFLPMHTLLVII